MASVLLHSYSKAAGRVVYHDLVTATGFPRFAGQLVVSHNGSLGILDHKDKKVEQCKVLAGAILLVKEGSIVQHGTELFNWNEKSIKAAEIIVTKTTLRRSGDSIGEQEEMFRSDRDRMSVLKNL